jgi:hypothetical protein
MARPSRKILCVLAGGFFGLLSAVVAPQAQPAPAPTLSTQEAVRADVLGFSRVAARFGCPKEVWTGINNGVLTIEYVPDDEDVRSWKNLVTVTVTPIPEGVPRGAASDRYIENILGALRQPGRKIEELIEKRYSGDNARAAWVLYTIGEGEAKEHNAAVVALFGPGEMKFSGRRWSVVMLQRQRRGARLEQAWITLSKAIFMAPFEKKG